MTYHDLLEEKDKNIRYLSRICAGLLLALSLAMWGWMSSAHDITVYYPPNLNVASTLKAGVVPEETIFSFAPLILQQLYLWEQSGEDNYEANRKRLRQFLTEAFQRQIRKEIETGKTKGTLRVARRMQLLPSSIYTEASVQPVGNHWLVWMDAEILDTVNGVEVYRGVHRLGVRVVRYDIDREFNPWQLALDGVESDTPLLNEKEARRLSAVREAG